MSIKRPAHVEQMYVGAERVQPGMYHMPDGSLLINAAEILAACGLEDTEADRALVAQVAREWCEKHGISDVREL